MTYVQSYLCIIGLTLCMKESKAVLAEETVKYVCSGDSIQLFRNVTIDKSDMVASLYIKASSERIIAMWTFTKGTIYEGYTTKIFLDKDGDIWIRNVSPSDEARYSLITGQGTNFVRYNVTLSVQVAPSINCKPSIIRVDDVLVASLDAKECGKPIASVDWFDYSGIQKKGNDNMLIKTNTYGIYYACISGPAVKCAKTEKPLDYCSAFAISDTTDNHDVSITLGIEHKVSTYFAGLLIAILLVVVLVSVLIFRSICKNLTSCRIENGTEDVEKSEYNAVPSTSGSSDDSVLPRIDVVRQITLNSSLLLQCKVCNTSGMLTKNILWKLNASLIEKEDRFYVSNDFLSISNLTAGDQYNVYTCMDQESEIESDPFKIQSSGPTAIKFTPNITAVFEHESMNVSCNSACSPLCKWQWAKLDPISGLERVVSGENVLQIQNFTKQNAGKYSCNVQNILSDATVVSHLSLDVIDTTFDVTTIPIRKDGTEATVLGKDIPTARSKEDDAEDNASPSKHLLMYMFLGFGIGILLAFVVFLCLKQNCQKREVNNITFQARVEEISPVEKPAENYWTIVSNAGGELSTALESNANQMYHPALIYNKDTSAVNQLETSEFMMQEDEMECDGYIHPIHTSTLNTGVSSRRHTIVV